jgi:hypothetical protein
MYDLTTLFTTIASCSATIIAIVGGFIANKLISLGIDRREITTHLDSIQEEIDFKLRQAISAKEKLNEEDALDFIHEYMDQLVFNKPVEDVFKPSKRTNISQDDLRPYWEQGRQIIQQLLAALGDDEPTNEDDIPISCMKAECSDFQYTVYKYGARYIRKVLKEQERKNAARYGLAALTDINSWAENIDLLPGFDLTSYQKKIDIMNEAYSATEWLELQKKQLLVRIDSLKRPQGMKIGLLILVSFSIFGIILPLCLVPYQTSDYFSYMILKALTIGLFSINISFMFVFYLSMLQWKVKNAPINKSIRD